MYLKKIFSPLMMIAGIISLAHMPLSAQSALWTNRLNGSGDNSDRFNQMVIDGAGNLYAAGYTVKPGQGKDFLVAKLNTAGDTLWTRTYNNAVNLDDEANFIALDASGNIIVTGSSDGGSSTTKTDIQTMMYSTSGILLWSARYNYTLANEDELPAALALDNAGNIFITGRSDHDAANVDDYITLKYNSAGLLQWEARYDAGNTDRGAGVVADQLGGCVVTGRSDNGVDDDIITISYNAAGAINWSATFAGAGGDDRGQSIARDVAGNIYVAGIRNNGGDDDFATIKYNASGIAQWQKFFNGGGNDRISTLKMDAAGNIYVTGQSDVDATATTDYDFRTICYSNTGLVLWNTTTGNPALQEDTPSDIWIDAAGNVYVTGKSDAAGGGGLNFEWMTVKYNNLGAQLWIKYYDGTTSNAEDIPATVLTDAAGNVWVTGSADFTATQKDATTLRYSSLGILNTTKTINGIGDFNDKVSAIATDASGNTYVTGYTIAAGQQRNLLLQKIGPTGTTLWTRTFDGTGENDEGLAVATDAAGNVYAAGYTNGTGTYDDILVIKFNNLGVLQWSQVFDHTAHQVDKAVALVISAVGDVYVTGYSDGDASAVTNYDFITLKYNSLGLLQWNVRYQGAGLASDKAVDCVFDGTNVYVTGTSSNGVNNDIAIIKYDILGNVLATTTFNGASNGDESCADMIWDGSNLYVAGASFVAGNFNDYITLKYSSALALQWSKTYNGTGDNEDIAFGVAATAGEVYVTGSSIGTSGAADIALIKYNKATGAQNWAKRYTGAGAFADEGYSVVSDGVDNIYTTGVSGNAATVSDYITLNYNSAGTKLLTLKYNGTGAKEDVAKRAIVDNNGYLYVTGYSTGSGKANYDFTTIKYCTPLPAATITAGGPTTICIGTTVTLSANTGTGLTYQWKKGNANIAGATLSTYVASTTGTYKCVVANSNGCTKTSNAINVTTITCKEGIIEDEIIALSVAPNPFMSTAVVDLSSLTAQAEIQVFDMTGRVVAEMIIEPGTASVEIGSDLPSGSYLMIVRNGQTMQKIQLVKM